MARMCFGFLILFHTTHANLQSNVNVTCNPLLDAFSKNWGNAAISAASGVRSSLLIFGPRSV